MEPRMQDRIVKVLGYVLGAVILLGLIAYGIYRLWVVFVWW